MEKKVLLSGAKIGFRIGLFGSLIFALIQMIYFSINFDWDFMTFVIFFIGGLILLLIPSIFGGLLLSYVLLNDFYHNRWTVTPSVIKGGIIGFLVSFGVSATVFIIISKHGGFNMLIMYSLEAIILGTSCGCFAGKQLYKDIENILTA